MILTRTSSTLILIALMTLTAFSLGEPPEMDMNSIAESYVRLVLAVGVHDPDYVDAYYGPPEWREGITEQPIPDLIREADQLLAQLDRIGMVTRFNEMGYLRHRYLTRQLQAVRTRLQMLSGSVLTFDEEAEALYDASPPSFGPDHFDAILRRLDEALPPAEGGPMPRPFRSARPSAR